MSESFYVLFTFPCCSTTLIPPSFPFPLSPSIPPPLPAPQVTKDLSRIKRFSAQEALDYGLVDKIVRPRRVKPDASSRASVAGLG